MQKVVRKSEGRALGVTSEDAEDGLLRVGADLGEVGEIVDVQVAGLADLEQLVGVLVDCKDLAESCEVVDLCLIANAGLAPLLLSEVHDLLRGSCALDGGRGHGEESVAALEGLDKLVRLLDRLCRVVGRDAVLSQCLGQVLDLAPVDLDLLAIDKKGRRVSVNANSSFRLNSPSVTTSLRLSPTPSVASEHEQINKQGNYLLRQQQQGNHKKSKLAGREIYQQGAALVLCKQSLTLCGNIQWHPFRFRGIRHRSHSCSKNICIDFFLPSLSHELNGIPVIDENIVLPTLR